ncbi:helix-turn-helix domain-containing protein [Erwinia sp. QL-Z3]|uniref:helix-turn-helix domain-containing protein n=1 Tax=Erwinia sp. QL-Z3 TaxID=2547962 RepID=UPI001FD7BBA3|nr:helix-turn-helix transcriptional regulator [Erwinia sp. QL-Z3]
MKAGMDEGSASGRMNHYEKGRHVPDIETLRKLSKVLDVPLSYFFCADELSAELVCLFQNLSDEKKEEMLTFLRHHKKV